VYGAEEYVREALQHQTMNSEGYLNERAVKEEEDSFIIRPLREDERGVMCSAGGIAGTSELIGRRTIFRSVSEKLPTPPSGAGKVDAKWQRHTTKE